MLAARWPGDESLFANYSTFYVADGSSYMLKALHIAEGSSCLPMALHEFHRP